LAGLIGQLSIPQICRTTPDAAGVSYGTTLERITGSTVATGGFVYLEGGQHTATIPTTIVAEHDARIPEASGLTLAGNYSQPRPWSWNQPYGSEVMRFWVACDGAIISNIGARVQGQGRLYLGIATLSGIIPVIVKGSTTVVADSDMLLDFLSPYSPRSISYLVNAGSPERWAGLLYYSACIFLGLLAWWNKITAQIAICVTLALLTALRSTLADKLETGDVRLEGIPKGWPHDSSIYGVPRSLNKEGYFFKIGPVGASVLCIGPGASARLHHEKLVVLSPGSRVHLPDGSIISAGEEPMGQSGGVPDARAIFKGESKEPLAVGEHKNDGIAFIASGSSGRISGWSRYLGRAEK
jgi:hypothetical protein